MIKAFVRYFKSVFSFLLGEIDKSRQELDSDPSVMQAKYNDIIHKKTSNIQEYKKAVAGPIPAPRL